MAVSPTSSTMNDEYQNDTFLREIESLDALIDGDVFTDFSRRLMYATDASAYRELPLAVSRPRHENDIIELVRFARKNKISLIPRTAGTSLAGQVVGHGLVVDMSRYMTAVLEVNEEERWARVQPGVIPDILNRILREKGLFFSPETSTSNRCMIGGMVANNCSGLHSVIYGSAREHTISARVVLSDSSVVEFGPMGKRGFHEKCAMEGLEGSLYRQIRDIFSDDLNRRSIRSEYPDPALVRRNTGYALDEMLDCALFLGKDARHESFNFCRLLAGSEGTLGIITEMKLHLDPLPPPEKVLVPVHVESVMEAIKGNLIALRHEASAVELMDKTILDLTKGNIGQKANRFFLEGDPGAILIVEFLGDSMEELDRKVDAMVRDFRNAGIGFHFPRVKGHDINRVWTLRKAGLGVLSRMQGDAKPVSVIEDTSVRPERLEAYISEFNQLLEKYGLSCVYHAHISVGELHLRPVLNLKDEKDVELFHTIALETAKLVKKYRGSLSGEHGDGRLRGEFIPLMLGDRNYKLIKEIKHLWDAEGIFNQGKIVDTPPMNSFLRFTPGQERNEPETFFDFSAEGGILRHIEQCNGSGDCRKTASSGGTMCPSYMATQDEWTTTRARANVLREFIGLDSSKNPYNYPEIHEVLDLCLACKACKSECPSSVDMAKLKSEFLQHWYDENGIPLRSRIIAYIASFNRIAMVFPWLYNFISGKKPFSSVLKRMLGFARERSLPALHRFTLRSWCRRNLQRLNGRLPEGGPEVIYFIDEFTNYNDVKIGISTIRLLNHLGVKVISSKHVSSGRSFLSKGFLRTARRLARKNVEILHEQASDDRLILGTEPSAILTFRDEYPDLVGEELREKALGLAGKVMLIEEYVVKLHRDGYIKTESFTERKASLKVHGHCQQKAIASVSDTLAMLSIPRNYNVEEIPTGCCGMAGSFGFEKEHYDLSMKVGELVLFPEIRKCRNESLIVAAGTSCRHQIEDGTGVAARHPAEILYEALK